MPTVEVNHVRMNFSESGSGPAVVLLHGFPLDCRMWDAQREALSEKWRVITPDLRGFGQSKLNGQFTMQSLADDVHTMLQELDALPCVLGGLSMGGYVALPFARSYANDLTGLMLVDTRAEADTAEAKTKRGQMIEMVRQKGSKSVADAMIPNLLAQPPEAAVERKLREICEACPPATIEAALIGIRDREDFTSALQAIKLPTLVMVGSRDKITPLAAAEVLHKAISGSELSVIEDAGHMTPMEQPAAVNRAMKAFLSSL